MAMSLQVLIHLFLFLISSCCFGSVSSFMVVLPPSSSSSRCHQRNVGQQRCILRMVPTELPDSLDDAAERAAQATITYIQQQQQVGPTRCRVDFDTTIGDETFSIMTTTTEFMQKYVSALCMGIIDGWADYKRNEIMQRAKAKAKRQADESSGTEPFVVDEEDLALPVWKGNTVRIVFPDEGSAALARRDWYQNGVVPICCRFSSCGGIRDLDLNVDEKHNDALVLYYCPKASESDAIERLLELYETNAVEDTNSTTTTLKASIFVNPNLVDMGVTGFGYAGRRLRERLIDTLMPVYYLRTLAWGALTRSYPNAYTVWQEDDNAPGGYRNIATLNRLPSNPEVEDIYDVENGIVQKSAGGGLLDQFGDFVNGMMKL